jgi:Family of unknown function (DUF6428)
MNQTISDIRVGKPCDATVESQGSCSNRSATTTRLFLDILHAARPDQQLVFQLNEAPLVAAGYHVTELKAVTYNTMDCGGVAGAWEETVIQLWNPGDEPERDYMTVRSMSGYLNTLRCPLTPNYASSTAIRAGQPPAITLSAGAARNNHPRPPPRSPGDLQRKGS